MFDNFFDEILEVVGSLKKSHHANFVKLILLSGYLLGVQKEIKRLKNQSRE